jgi:hypothetical protein
LPAVFSVVRLGAWALAHACARRVVCVRVCVGRRDALGVVSFGLSAPSLEEVFVRLVERAEVRELQPGLQRSVASPGTAPVVRDEELVSVSQGRSWSRPQAASSGAARGASFGEQV